MAQSLSAPPEPAPPEQDINFIQQTIEGVQKKLAQTAKKALEPNVDKTAIKQELQNLQRQLDQNVALLKQAQKNGQSGKRPAEGGPTGLLKQQKVDSLPDSTLRFDSDGPQSPMGM